MVLLHLIIYLLFALYTTYRIGTIIIAPEITSEVINKNSKTLNNTIKKIIANTTPMMIPFIFSILIVLPEVGNIFLDVSRIILQ